MDDLISRQAALDALDILCQEHKYKIPGKSETYSQYNEAWQDALDRAEGAIINLPSAQPERKKGEWKQISKNLSSCTSCGNCILTDRTSDSFYCPNCGADMREPKTNAEQPERKKGKWEMRWHPFFRMEVPMCSACETLAACKTDVCPHCGADMRGET